MKLLLLLAMALSISGAQAQEKFSDLNFQQTVDVINIRLAKWSEKGRPVSIIALNNGDVIVANNKKQTLRFSLLDIKDAHDQKHEGIETIPCDPRAHAPLAWINFKSALGTVGFIRLDCNTPEAELDNIRGAFKHLKSLCKKSSAFNNPPYEALYFVSRNAVLQTENEMLQGSIRSVDTKEIGGKTITVKSNGEGWLDKDSMPISRWHFYSIDSSGKEYLFKTGTYERTKPGMFNVMGIDSSDLAKNHHLTFHKLQLGHLHTIPFIKSLAWEYYNPNGKFWKTVYYKNRKIPLSVSIVMMDTENMDNTRLVINLKEDKMDEWPEGDGKENGSSE